MWTEGKSVKEKLRFQKSADTCGRGLNQLYDFLTHKTKLTKLSNVIPVVSHGQYKFFFNKLPALARLAGLK